MKETTTGRASADKASLNSELSLFLRDSSAFNDWHELRDCIVNGYGLEDAIIRLQQDYSKDSAEFRYESRQIIESSEDSILLAMNVGYRVRLSVHLVRSLVDAVREPQGWPRADFEAILRCAKSIFERTVRDRVVDLMSRQVDTKVVSFFLDDDGKIELASSNARSLCQEIMKTEELPADYLPDSFWDYAKLMQRSLDPNPRSLMPSESSVVYGYFNGELILDCLLQKMGPSGSLLCLSVDRQ